MDLLFHHLGVACRNLDVEEAVWVPLGYTREGDDFEDPRQQIRGRFLTGPGPRLGPCADGRGDRAGPVPSTKPL